MNKKTHAINMVHHNPGDAPLDTIFSEPETLSAHGFTGQAFKHINTVVRFDGLAPGVFPADDAERGWLEGFTAERDVEIRAAKAAGLSVFYHIDLFVLPKAVVEHFREEICDPETGRISPLRPKTLELHREMLAELFRRWPEIDGLIVRVGETYLMDTPHHTGNGAVDYGLGADVETMYRQFECLLAFLREEVCVRHSRWLFHRTWDTHPDRFHASAEFYLRVTDRIEPHPKLVFSIKHTRFDFHRFTPVNPCLGIGRHRQILEVQCQREYEGKGAYPNYIVRGLMEGLPEIPGDRGVAPFFRSDQCVGLYTWSRGGGWHGPRVTRENEFWCRLNFAVLAEWQADPEAPEAALFERACQTRFGLSPADTAVLRAIALLSEDGVLRGKLCSAYDARNDRVPEYPTNMWMRDDVLQGYDKLAAVFDKLMELGALAEALEEKKQAVRDWEKIRALCERFSGAMEGALREEIVASAEYGLRFFRAVADAWQLLAAGYAAWHAGEMGADDREGVRQCLEAFHRAWSDFRAIHQHYPRAAGLYRGEGWHWPKQPPGPGLLASVEEIGDLLAKAKGASGKEA